MKTGTRMRIWMMSEVVEGVVFRIACNEWHSISRAVRECVENVGCCIAILRLLQSGNLKVGRIRFLVDFGEYQKCWI